MPKKVINAGDSVVFSRRYLPEEPLAELYGSVGIVLSTDETQSKVDFDIQGVMTVTTTDLEIIELDELTNHTVEASLEFMEDHELGGMQKSQLIAHKILAQETDPKLNRDINLLLNAQ